MPPIDPGIIMGLQPMKRAAPSDPFEEHGSAMRLKALMGQNELQGLQTDQARRGMARDDARRDAYRRSAGDNKVLRSLLGEIGDVEGIQALEKFERDKLKDDAAIAKDRAAAGKSEFEVAMGKLERGAALLGSVKDQASYDAAIRIGKLTGTFRPELQFPPEYNPQMVTAFMNNGVTRAQQLEQEHKAKDLALRGANEPFAQGPNGPVANEPVQRFQLDKAKKGASNVSVKTDVKTGESLGAQVGPMMRDSTSIAEGAVKQVDAAQRIVKAIDSGQLFAGPAANQRVTLAQVSQVLGVGGKDEAEKLANTRAAMRGLAELTLQGRQQMKGQGAITESEGKLAEKAMSGDIADLTAAEIRQLARASERAARFNHNEHLRKLKVMQDNPQLNQIAPFYQGPAISGEIPDPPAQGAVSDVRSQADAILNGGRR